MKPILTMAIVAVLSLFLSSCWVYSRPVGDSYAGCQKTTYGLAVATTSSENCTPLTTPSTTAAPVTTPPIPAPAQM